MHSLATGFSQVDIVLAPSDEQTIIYKIIKPLRDVILARTEQLDEMGEAPDLDHLLGGKLEHAKNFQECLR